MALIRWSPFQELADVRREMQSLASLMPRFVPFGGEDRFVPALDCTSRGEDLVCRVELPGMDPENDVDVNVEQGVLRISGQRRAERDEQRGDYHFREMRYGTFQRTLPLPENVTADDVSAEYRDGILEVTVKGGAKEIEPQQAQRIQINRGSGEGRQGEQRQLGGEQGQQQGQQGGGQQSQQGGGQQAQAQQGQAGEQQGGERPTWGEPQDKNDPQVPPAGDRPQSLESGGKGGTTPVAPASADPEAYMRGRFEGTKGKEEGLGSGRQSPEQGGSPEQGQGPEQGGQQQGQGQ